MLGVTSAHNKVAKASSFYFMIVIPFEAVVLVGLICLRASRLRDAGITSNI